MKRFLGIILQLIGALTVFAILAGSILMVFAGYWMDVNDEPAQSDYILPLAGNSHRLIKAAELYRQGFAPVILISNAYLCPPDQLQKLQWKMGFPHFTPRQYRSLLLKLLGAETAQLEEFGNGHVSTVEEAEALRVHLGGKPAKLLIVTSPYHARRAKMIFEEILPNCEITMVTTRDGAFKKSWWTDQESAQNLVMEFAKTVHYLFGGVYRSTDQVTGS